jgi:hypothetical protein
MSLNSPSEASGFLLLQFGFRTFTVDVIYIVVNTPALALRGVGHHDVVGLAQQDFRVELLALADGASHPWMAFLRE